MSRTMIMLWWLSSNTASPTTSATDWRYPWVRNRSAFSTRSGVLTKPSRLGSSPSDTRIRRIRSANGSPAWAALDRTRAASAAFILDIVARCLPEPEPQLEAGRNRGTELSPGHDGDVLRGGIDLLEPGHVHVQVL